MDGLLQQRSVVLLQPLEEKLARHLNDKRVVFQFHWHYGLKPGVESVLAILSGEVVADKSQTLVPYSLILVLHVYMSY